VAAASGGEPPYRWSWTLGGAVVSTLENFSYTFTAEGKYAVAGTVTDSAAFHVTESFEINVTNPLPLPLTVTAAASVLAGEAPLVVSFTGASTGGVAPYTLSSWDFGDGTTASGWNTSHSFNYSGTFTVTFRATDSTHATAETSLVIVVSPALSVTASASRSAGAAPFNVTFTATAAGGLGPYYYLWEFGDGASGIGATAAHSYVRAGSFVASVEAVDSGGHTAGYNVSVVVTAGTSPSPSTTNSGSTGLSFDTTAVLVGAELALGGVAVAGIVAVARRRR